MSFGKSLLSVFVELEDKPQESPKQTPQFTNQPAPSIIAAPIASSPTNFGSLAPVLSDEDKAAIDNMIDELFNSLNDPKPSYHELKSLSMTLKSSGLNLSSTDLLRTALVSISAQTPGATINKTTLIDDINRLKQCLVDAEKNFRTEAQTKNTTRTETVTSRVTEIDKEIAQLSEKIKQLNDEKVSLVKTAQEKEVINNTKVEYFTKKIADSIQVLESDLSSINNL